MPEYIQRDNFEFDSIQTAITSLQDHMALYGYQHIDTPLINRADLFLTKAGDRIAEQLFTFERHGQVWALRPEFTAAAAYRYMLNDQPHQPVRWQFSGPIFRDAHGSSGNHQQYSAGAEAIGLRSVLIEAEIIAMAAHGLLKLDVADWTLVIGHVGLTRYLIERFGLDPRTQRQILYQREVLRDGKAGRKLLLSELESLFSTDADSYVTDKIGIEASAHNLLGAMFATSHHTSTMGGRTNEDIARRLSQKQQQTAQRARIEDAVDFLADWMQIYDAPEIALPIIEKHIDTGESAGAIFEEVQDVLKLLNAYDVPQECVMIQPDLARSWDYYTGTVFEIRTTDGRLLAGGGRYDELTRLLGAETGTPAFGFAYEIETIAQMRSPEGQAQLLRLRLQPANRHVTIQWAQTLRRHQLNVSLTETTDTDDVMFVDEKGDLHFNGQSYTRAEIDQLVASVRDR